MLVVAAIIGILAAIAIPALSAYRAAGFDAHAARARNDLTEAAEAYFARNGRYAASVFDLSSHYPPNRVVVRLDAAPVSGFTAESYHPEGTRTFARDSRKGDLQP